MRFITACAAVTTCACFLGVTVAGALHQAVEEAQRKGNSPPRPGVVRAGRVRHVEKGSPLDVAANPVPNREEIHATDVDLTKKLKKMKELIYGIHSGVDKSSRLRATSMKQKFNKLSAVIAALAEQKDALYRENVKMRKEMKSTVERLQRVEMQLKIEAKRADDNDVKRWFEAKSSEISEYLHSNGLQNYADPKFSPIVAGLVIYGLVLFPLMAASGYIMRHIKSLSLVHALKAISIFEVGYVAISLLSMLLLVTLDPFHAMRHISEINFVFLQILLACFFWTSACILSIETMRTRAPGVRTKLIFQLIVRLGLAYDYGQRVWAPVVERSDDALFVSPARYAGYTLAVFLTYRLTSSAVWWTEAARSTLQARDLNTEAPPVLQWGGSSAGRLSRQDEEAPAPGPGMVRISPDASTVPAKASMSVPAEALASVQRLLPSTTGQHAD